MSDDIDGYSMIMPFVVVKSVGGPYEDEAFVAGFELGKLWAELVYGPSSMAVSIRSASLRQADLIAMHFGYVLTAIGPIDDVDGWASIELTRAPPDPEGTR